MLPKPGDDSGGHFRDRDGTAALERLQQRGNRIAEAEAADQEARAVRWREPGGKGAQRGFGSWEKPFMSSSPLARIMNLPSLP